MTARVIFALSLTLFAALAAASDRRIISENITVGEGDTLRFAPGAEVLFSDFAGITVNGYLEALGTKKKPITFSSVNDTSGGATPFDWNGIEISGAGSARFANVRLRNATSGISSEKPTAVTLDECVFVNNGQWHLSIAGEVQNVPDGRPYSFPTVGQLNAADAAALTPTADAPPKSGKSSRLKLAFRIPAAALAIGGLAGGIYYNSQVVSEHKKYNAEEADPAKVEKYRTNTEDYESSRALFYILGAVGLSGFTVTLFF